MKALEPCKVVVFGGIKEFRLKLKQLGIGHIVNDDESIKESDVVLILINKINEKFIALNTKDLLLFNRIDTKLISDNEIKEITYIQNGQSIEDFKFDTNKIYYAKSVYGCENEYWLFKPKNEKQECLTEHFGCLCICNNKVDYDECIPGTIMDNNEIIEFREATPSETEIYVNNFLKNYKNE